MLDIENFLKKTKEDRDKNGPDHYRFQSTEGKTGELKRTEGECGDHVGDRVKKPDIDHGRNQPERQEIERKSKEIKNRLDDHSQHCKDQSRGQKNAQIILIRNPRNQLGDREEGRDGSQKSLQNLEHGRYVNIFLMRRKASLFSVKQKTRSL